MSGACGAGMPGSEADGEDGVPAQDGALARDWATVWQSEAAALATDRELREAWRAGVGEASGAGGGAEAPPGPMRRRGPRPLALHLWAAGAQGGPDAALVAGVAAYRRHPFRREMPDPACLWQEGGTRLLDYGAPGAGGVAVLFVPSLVNRAQVLDLMPGRSLLRSLAARGVRPLLLDWGWPGEAERRFTLTDYVAGRLERAVAALGGPVVLAGYCMGGLLCTALAQRRPELVAALALLATPWDFHADDEDRVAGEGGAGRSWTPDAVVRALALLEPGMAASGALGVDALQTLFEGAAPGAVAAKYRGFGREEPDSGRARCFVAIEDWLADGVPLAAPVARECLGGWYGANSPARGAWRVAGLAVVPGALRLPSLVAVPTRDRIVPAGSALALGRLIAGSVVLRPAAGHVGMVVGSRAEAELWGPLLDWLRRQGCG
ncbi:MAG: alpha/beta fold hydrolase [Janthinobacterium lividum]